MTELTTDPNADYQHFIEQVRKSGQAWALQSEEGWLIVDSVEFEDTDVMPLWSDEAYARVHCVGEWAHFKPVAIGVDELIADWLPGMDEDGTLVGPNWNADLEGLEFEAIEIAERLSAE
jgi:hypothetical protein